MNKNIINSSPLFTKYKLEGNIKILNKDMETMKNIFAHKGSYSAIRTDKIYNYLNAFYNHTGYTKGSGICNCNMIKRNFDGSDTHIHTCGRGFWDSIENSSFNQQGPAYGRGIYSTVSVHTLHNPSGEGIFDTIKSGFKTVKKAYDAIPKDVKKIGNTFIDSVKDSASKRKGGAINIQMTHKQLCNMTRNGPYSHKYDDNEDAHTSFKGEGFGWGRSNISDSGENLKNYIKEGIDTVSKII